MHKLSCCKSAYHVRISCVWSMYLFAQKKHKRSTEATTIHTTSTKETKQNPLNRMLVILQILFTYLLFNPILKFQSYHLEKAKEKFKGNTWAWKERFLVLEGLRKSWKTQKELSWSCRRLKKGRHLVEENHLWAGLGVHGHVLKHGLEFVVVVKARLMIIKILPLYQTKP